ncbi:MAG: DUF1697 domain-containing protein [Candidatus Promineifilaceae bacterium]|nr:DUF1697 domain-containing protein [Candidatus Promineifilaceae bacterium]
MNNEGMITYVAFLRGINVGGHNRMKMAALRQTFADLGLENAETYIQSGNVVFRSTETNADLLQERIEAGIEKTFGYEIAVMVRTRGQLENVVANNPFTPADGDENIKLYVTFLNDVPSEEQRQILYSAQSDAETFAVEGDIIYSRLDRNRQGKRGRRIDVRKKLGISATRRNWRVVNKVLELANSA